MDFRRNRGIFVFAFFILASFLTNKVGAQELPEGQQGASSKRVSLPAQDLPDVFPPVFELVSGEKMIQIGSEGEMCSRLESIRSLLVKNRSRYIFGRFLNNVYFEDRVFVPKPFWVDQTTVYFQKYFLRAALRNNGQDSKKRDQSVRKSKRAAEESFFATLNFVVDNRCASPEKTQTQVEQAKRLVDTQTNSNQKKNIRPKIFASSKGVGSRVAFFEDDNQVIIVNTHNAAIGKICVSVCETQRTECKTMLIREILVASKRPVTPKDFESPYLTELVKELNPEQRTTCENKELAKQVRNLDRQTIDEVDMRAVQRPRIYRPGPSFQ